MRRAPRNPALERLAKRGIRAWLDSNGRVRTSPPPVDLPEAIFSWLWGSDRGQDRVACELRRLEREGRIGCQAGNLNE